MTALLVGCRVTYLTMVHFLFVVVLQASMNDTETLSTVSWDEIVADVSADMP